ncbi:MAG: beta-lactamase family protein [Opitutales bacterium]|nr:beta-lactamase family protein [Opitutales bacterium]
MKKCLFSVFSLILFFLGTPFSNLVAGDSFDQKRLDDYLNHLFKNDKFMGSVSVSKNGEAIYQKSVGFSSIEHRIPNHEQTVMRIGSITKTYTAVMILQLVEEGLLSMDSKLMEFYPEIKNADKIEIEHLLSHTSGLENLTNKSDYQSYYQDEQTRESMLKRLRKLGSDFEPGERTAYSNTNYVLLGYILESITDEPYEQILYDRIVTPLKTIITYVGKPIDPRDNEASSYRWVDGEWVEMPETHLSVPHGAGSVVSCPNDVNEFLEALFNTETLLKKETVDLMIPKNAQIGKGLIAFPFYKQFGFGHNGGIDGFLSNSAYFPKTGYVVSVFTNGVAMNFNDVLIGVLSIVNSKSYEFPDFTVKAVEMEDVDYASYCGVFASQQLPLKIKIFEGKNGLKAQATGQSAFPLTSFSKTEFRFEQGGITIKFKEADSGINYDQFTLLQGGGSFLFKKEKNE